jgi:Ser/Thr protein kinase RdoA (MazF antagonist)
VLATLVGAGLIDAATACDGEVSLHDDSRSNPVDTIVVEGTPTLVVKQAGPAADAQALMNAETSIYRWLGREPQLAALAPSCLTIQGGDGWLVLEAPSDARTAHDLLGSLGGDLTSLVVELAAMLGTLHTVSAERGRGGGQARAQWPWLFDLPSGGVPEFAAAREGSRRVVAELRERPDLMALIEETGAGWSDRALIHGDVKWDNVLARRGAAGGWRLWLIDWELAGWGDPDWDLAALCEAIVTTAVLREGAFDSASVAPLCRAAIDAYAAGVDPFHKTGADRLACLIASRLLQVVVQLAAMAADGESVPATTTLLELASRVAADPPSGAAKLFDA